MEELEKKELGENIMEEVKELGYEKIEDMNEEKKIGLGNWIGNVRKGKRWNKEKEFIGKIKLRENINVDKNDKVKRILINEKKKKDYGVEFKKKEGKIVYVKFRNEVIL